MAYVLNPSNKTQIHNNNGTNEEITIYSVLVEAQADLADIPDSVGVGSLAYTAGFGHVWHKDFDGSWVEVVLE